MFYIECKTEVELNKTDLRRARSWAARRSALKTATIKLCADEPRCGQLEVKLPLHYYKSTGS